MDIRNTVKHMDTMSAWISMYTVYEQSTSASVYMAASTATIYTKAPMAIVNKRYTLHTMYILYPMCSMSSMSIMYYINSLYDEK